MENPDAAAALLDELKELGVHLSLDDFGTGFSSLSYLHRFPFDTLKIDRAFVSRIANGENEGIVRTILALARELGLTVVAEGVETRPQLDRLAELLCPAAQGAFFAMPLPVEDAESFLTI